jgi:hypothetical protein
MRIRQVLALALAMSAGTAIAVAQLGNEEPAVGIADKVQKPAQEAIAQSEADRVNVPSNR